MISELIHYHTWFIYLSIAILSLCVGSLLNVIIYRLPLMLEADWKAQCCELLQCAPVNRKEKINLFFPRSFCPQCKQTVAFWCNIPLLSYLILKGKCYHCHHSIGIRYPLIESLTVLVSLYAAWHCGLTVSLLYILPALWTLIVLIFIDWDHQILPDCLTLSLLWLGLIANTNHLFTSLPDAVFSAAGAYFFLWIFIRIFYLITGKIGMGNGDFKLYAAFGAWFGWQCLPFILLIASITGAIAGLILIKISKGNKETPIPFGPFLGLSGIIYLFWGKQFILWYLNTVFN